MEFVLEVLGAAIAIAFFTSITIQLLKPLLDKISIRWRDAVINLLSLLFGLGWAFLLALVQGWDNSTAALALTFVRGVAGGALATFGWELVTNMLNRVSRSGDDNG